MVGGRGVGGEDELYVGTHIILLKQDNLAQWDNACKKECYLCLPHKDQGFNRILSMN